MSYTLAQTQSKSSSSKAIANNMSHRGISMAAVSPIQRKGEKLTFAEMSIYPPGNSKTIAEVTLDGVSLDKWDNSKGQHAEIKIVDDLETKYARKLKKARVLSLIINRAPCKPCAEKLVKLKTDYGIEIRVKSTIITPEGEMGLPLLQEAGIPFRLYTIDQREALSDNNNTNKRKWKGDFESEEQRIAKTLEGNKRDLITASKDLSTDEGRRAEEQKNIEKAIKAGYKNPAASWKALGQSREELTVLANKNREMSIDEEGKNDTTHPRFTISNNNNNNVVTKTKQTYQKIPAVSKLITALKIYKFANWQGAAKDLQTAEICTGLAHDLIRQVNEALHHLPREKAEQVSKLLPFLELCTLDVESTRNNTELIPEYIGELSSII